MAEKDSTQIKVGKFAVCVIGINQLMEEMAGTYADKSDDVICSFMLDSLGQRNHIPDSAKEEYGKAFVREFRKFPGQPYTEDVPQGLELKVLGTGCPQCDALTQMTMEVLTEIKLPAAIDHVRDIKETVRYSIMGSPALLINGKTVAVGSIPARNRVKKWLIEAGKSLKGEQ